ncbi:MAG: aminopeptidase, partial [Clostridia bacterium]|nr:aminopeptidase [Clostridia bacterium]
MDLTYKRQNIYAVSDEAERKRIFEYNEGYKKFLDNGKTERETVAETVAMVEAAGYKPYTLGDKINKGDKLYYNNRGKALFILRAGTADVAKNGVRILVAHVDSPRLDLKQVPLFEKSDMAYLKTHYYGGIKKYQWLTIPLALHGVVVLKNGNKVNVNIGESESDPVFYISDLLPHLSQDQYKQTISEGFQAENLNLLIGGIPAAGEDKEAVKKGVLALLNEKYGMVEEDFLSA